MKKVLVLAAAMMAVVMSAKAEIEFAYDAGAEIVSSYIWRGQYNGGLSFQPDVEIGWDGSHTSFRAGVWASLGASDYRFRSGLATYTDPEDGETLIDPNSRFMPELDVVISFRTYGLTVGLNHYYYFKGSNFFSWESVQKLSTSNNSSTTEIWAGYNFGELTKAGVYFNWYTTIAGQDLKLDPNDNYVRAFSSYFEVGYDYTFEDHGITIGALVGMSPWESPIYGNSKFAVTNVALKFNKEWEFDHVTLDLFAQGSINPDGVNKNNVFIKGSGDEKLYRQRLNGVIGLGFWF